MHMAMRLHRRRRILFEETGDASRPFRINATADPFGDVASPPYDAVRSLTENGDLPELFADLPIELIS
jgi:hypothetical protein